MRWRIIRSLKHIDIKYYFVREQVEPKEFESVYVPTSMMQADFMTMNLPRPKFEKTSMQLVSLKVAKQELKKSRIKKRLCIIVAHSAQFYDDQQRRMERDQADDNRGKICYS